MIEITYHYDRLVRIGVNWDGLDQDLLTCIMDENAQRAAPQGTRAVMVEVLITSTTQSA